MSQPITNVEDAVREQGALPMPAGSEPQLTPKRLAEIRDLIRYESSIAFYSHRAKESVLLLIAEAEEAARLRARVAEQDTQREALAERLRAGQRWQRGRRPELVSENLVSQSELRDIFGIPLVAPWDEPHYDPCHPCGCPKRFDRHADGCPGSGAEGGGGRA
ncbi:hypothetical protein DMH25_08330 [Streptomyces sp. WAC 01325]|uniref:hypothetical protein n=1 Tax=Streptomyces sp. WAC 01325 TaxID=2203202 RepID=UPI000F86E4BE|nr:hypothetical protein [Streptomyces sp. WAC 01325]RSN13784.1 hypothetical protein DMH25_08330 [Streptomyces sp. WAC 01325]